MIQSHASASVPNSPLIWLPCPSNTAHVPSGIRTGSICSPLGHSAALRRWIGVFRSMRHDPAWMFWTKSATSADFVGTIVHASTKALSDKQCERNDDDRCRCPAPLFTPAQRLPVPRRRSRKRNPDLNHAENPLSLCLLELDHHNRLRKPNHSDDEVT